MSSSLKDAMGMQEIRFSSREVQILEIKVTDWIAGSDNDFCISEVQLLSNGKPIDWGLTPLLLTTAGSDCGCGTTWHVVDRSGKAIREAGVGEGDTWLPDPSGRYVFSSALTRNYWQFYVLDMASGKFVAHADREKKKDWYVSYGDVAWKSGEATVKVSWDQAGVQKKAELITLRWKSD
jgi:hypothetical protein